MGFARFRASVENVAALGGFSRTVRFGRGKPRYPPSLGGSVADPSGVPEARRFFMAPRRWRVCLPGRWAVRRITDVGRFTIEVVLPRSQPSIVGVFMPSAMLWIEVHNTSLLRGILCLGSPSHCMEEATQAFAGFFFWFAGLFVLASSMLVCFSKLAAAC